MNIEKSAKKIITYCFLIFFIFFNLSCSPYLKADVETLKDPMYNFKNDESFYISLLDDQKNDIMLRKIAKYVVNELEYKGFSYDNGLNTELIVGINYVNELKKEYIPERLEYKNQYIPGKIIQEQGTLYGNNNNINYSGSTYIPGEYKKVPITTGGYYDYARLKGLVIIIFSTENNDFVKIYESVIWDDDVEKDNFMNVAKCLVKEALRTFPDDKKYETIIDTEECYIEN